MLSKGIHWLLLIGLATICWSGEAQGAENEAVAKITSARTSAEVERAYGQLFAEVDSDTWQNLRTSRDSSIALRVAWQDLLSTLETTGPVAQFRNFNETHRFLGLVEGRTQAVPPAWWSKALVDGDVDHGVFTFDVPTGFGAYDFKGGSLGVRAGVRISANDDRIFIAVGEDSVSLAKSVWDNCFPGEGQVDVLFLGRCCYIAVHTDAGYKFLLAAFDTETGRLRWQSSAWSIGRGVCFGIGYHLVTMVPSDDRLIVFGLESRGLYVEGFRCDDGKPEFRFCSGYMGGE